MKKRLLSLALALTLALTMLSGCGETTSGASGGGSSAQTVQPTKGAEEHTPTAGALTSDTLSQTATATQTVEPTQTPEPTQMPEPTQTPEPEAAIEAYKEVLDLIYHGIQSQWSTYDPENQNNPGIEISYMWYQYPMQSLSDAGYALIDINNDQVPELFIGGTLEAGNGMFYDLYSYLDGSVIHVVSSGERDRYYLCANQIIGNEGSSGASDSVFGFYRFKTGTKNLTLREIVRLYDMGVSGGPWFYGVVPGQEVEEMEPISEKQANEILNKYKDVPIELTALDQYLPRESSQITTSAVPDKVPDLFPIDYIGLTVDELTELWGGGYKLGEHWVLGKAKSLYYPDNRIPLVFYFVDSNCSNTAHGDDEIAIVEVDRDTDSIFESIAPGIPEKVTYDELISLGYQGTLCDADDGFMTVFGETATFMMDYDDNISLSFYWYDNADPHTTQAETIWISKR